MNRMFATILAGMILLGVLGLTTGAALFGAVADQAPADRVTCEPALATGKARPAVCQPADAR